MSSEERVAEEALWEKLVFEPTFMARAYRRAFAELGEKFDGHGSDFEKCVTQLSEDVKLIRGAILEGKRAGLKPIEVPDASLISIFTTHHKFLFSKHDETVDYYIPSVIFLRE